MTTIQDVVTYVDGSTATGKIILTWPPMQYGGVAIAAGQQEYPIGPGGEITIVCYPCIGAEPLGVYFTATYELDKGAVYDEYWLVPNTNTTTIGAIRVSAPATPSIMINAQQLTASGAQAGQILAWNGANWAPMWTLNVQVATVVQSFNGRVNAVMPTQGDYTAGMITGPTLADNAVSQARRINTTLPLTGGGDLSQDLTLGVNPAEVVPGTRQVIAGFGLTGGGPLITDVTLAANTSQLAGAGLQGGTGATPLSVVPDTTVQQVQAELGGALVGTRPALNFMAGSGTTFNVVDNPSNNRVDITVSLSSTGGPATPSIYSVNGAPIGTQPELNLIAGANTTISGVDNDAANRVDVTVQSTATSFWQGGAGGAIYYSGGFVGMGSATPSTHLAVVGDAQNWAALPQTTISITDTDATLASGNGGRLLRIMNRRNTGIISQNLSTTDGQNFYLDNTANGGLWMSLTNQAISIAFAAAATNPVSLPATPAFYVNPTGVGIGTTTPQMALDVVGRMRAQGWGTAPGSGVGVEIGYDGTYGRISAYNRNTATWVSLTLNNLLTCTSSAVGIGTITPQFPLHVVGGIAADEGSNIYTTLGVPAAQAGSPNTYASMWYDSATNTLQIAALTGGVAWRNIALQPTGQANVGIATASPNFRLSLGSNLVAREFAIYDNGVSYYGIGMDSNAMRFESGSNIPGNTHTTGGFNFYTNADTGTNVPALCISPLGRVGIQTNSPVGTFHIHCGAGSNLEYFSQQNLPNGIFIQSVNDTSNQYAGLQMEGTPVVLNLSSGGNVGIGIAPNARLQVRGNIWCDPTGSNGATSGMELNAGPGYSQINSFAGQTLALQTGGGTTMIGAASLPAGSGTLVVHCAANANLWIGSVGGTTIGFQFLNDTYSGGASASWVVYANSIQFFTGSVSGFYQDPSAHVGINTTSVKGWFNVSAVSEGAPPALGSPSGSFNLMVGGNAWGLIMGALNNGNSYIQAQRSDGNPTYYHLLVQPNGGNTAIGDLGTGLTPWAPLVVSGPPTTVTLNSQAASNFSVVWPGGTELTFTCSPNAPNPISLQTRHYSASGNYYPLMLNPLGGIVGIGMQTPLGATGIFQVYGRSDLIAQGEPYALRLDYSQGGNGIYLGVNSGGSFCVSSNGGGALMVIDQSGNASITAQLTVGSYVHCNAGGYYFPDGTLQTTAAAASGIQSIATYGNSGVNGSATLSPGQHYNFMGCSIGTESGGVVVTVNASDARLKQNIEPLVGGLSVIGQMRPIRAQWNGLMGHPKGQPLASLIAQEVQPICPEAVFSASVALEPGGDPIDLMGLDPLALISHLVLAVQQLQQQVTDLRGGKQWH